MARIPTEAQVITPHGAYGYQRVTPKDGGCGFKNIYPCVHKGVDLAGKAGTPVYAPERFKVTAWAKDDVTRPLRGFGPGALRGIGASGVTHILGHLDPAWWDETQWKLPDDIFDSFRGKTRMPKDGRVYQEGEQVGVTSKRNHVHWEVLLKAKPVDPIAWVHGELGPAGGAAAGGGGMGWLIVAGLLYASSNGRRR